MCILKAKVVGLNFHKEAHVVESGDYVTLVAEDNKHDPDAVAVYNGNNELIGYIANSNQTLSPGNKKNGTLSASELKDKLDFTDKEFYGEVDRALPNCLFIMISDEKWSYINKHAEDVPNQEFVKASDLVESDFAKTCDEVATLKAEIESLKAIVLDLNEIVLDLKLIAISARK